VSVVSLKPYSPLCASHDIKQMHDRPFVFTHSVIKSDLEILDITECHGVAAPSCTYRELCDANLKSSTLPK